ncbi:MAG: methylmalonyl-CoA mutase family protein [Flavobacteriales bacterium]|jgi:methylmalonyl-CoA mutase
MKQEIHFEEFPKPNHEEWMAAVQKELAGKSFESLLWHPTEGIKLDPYYHRLKRNLTHIDPTRESWAIGQWIDFTSEKETNLQMLKSLEGGANFIHLNIPATVQTIDFSILFKDVYLEYIEIALTVVNGNQLVQQFSHFCNESDSLSWKGAVYTKSGTVEELENNYTSVVFKNKNIHSLCIDISAVQNNGGSGIDAIVYALLNGKEILNRMIVRGYEIDDLAASLRFRFATDTSYFQEIAKYKAFRILWAQVINAYQPKHKCSENTIIDSVSCTFSMATLDAENNLLRSTISSMAAAIGGADTITNLNFNYFLEENDSSSSRYARNILHLLKEESYFDSARDAVKGAYYVEELIYQTAEAALNKFKALCDLPFEEAIEVINSSVASERALKVSAFENGTKTILGVNKYPNKKDSRMKAVVKSLDAKRLSQELESRLRNMENL